MPPIRLKTRTPFSPPAIAELINFGIVEHINGIFLGRLYAYDMNMHDRPVQKIKDQSYRTDFPMLLNVEVGHTDSIHTDERNASVDLDFDMGSVTVWDW